MRLLLTAVLLIGANAGMAFGEGRYQVVSLGTSETWVVIDTKTGSSRYCFARGPDKRPHCSPWTEK